MMDICCYIDIIYSVLQKFDLMDGRILNNEESKKAGSDLGKSERILVEVFICAVVSRVVGVFLACWLCPHHGQKAEGGPSTRPPP